MKKLLLVLSLVAIGVISLSAQRTISGKVTDESGEALIGATILVKGTSSGTVSDIDGNYTVNVPEGGTTLIISYTGFSSQEVEIGATDVADIVLTFDAVGLDDVVVIGYGSQRRKRYYGFRCLRFSRIYSG